MILWIFYGFFLNFISKSFSKSYKKTIYQESQTEWVILFRYMQITNKLKLWFCFQGIFSLHFVSFSLSYQYWYSENRFMVIGKFVFQGNEKQQPRILSWIFFKTEFQVLKIYKQKTNKQNSFHFHKKHFHFPRFQIGMIQKKKKIKCQIVVTVAVIHINVKKIRS